MLDKTQINPSHRYLLINGPPRSGKDTLATLLHARDANSRQLRFAKALKDATHSAYGIVGVPHDHYEHSKDVPSDDFFGLTPRQAYIKHSEEYMKPAHGKDVYAKLLVRCNAEALMSPTPTSFYVPDSGFLDETVAFADLVGVSRVQLVRVHRTGYDFSNDSRGYVRPDTYGIASFDVYNNTATPVDMVAQVESAYYNSLLYPS